MTDLCIGSVTAARQARSADHARWDEFVRRHPHGSPFHLQAWRNVIEEAFGYKPMYLLAERDGSIEGVLPLFLVSNVLIRKALISSPFAVYGGILANSRDAAVRLYGEAKLRAEALGVEYVELRNAYPEQCVSEPNVARYVTFTQRITPSQDALLEAIPRKTRYMVRKSLKHGFACKVTQDPGAFQEIYSENLRRLGTPSFPPRYFQALLKHFGNSVDIREYHLEGKVVAAVLSFYFRDQILPYYGAALQEYNAFAPSNYMYFDLMRWGGQNGYHLFDFGRSKLGSGSYEFKAHWGMEERPLPYELLPIRRKTLPNYSPANPRYQLPIKVWQRLPLWFTRAVGPALVRLVP